MEGKKRMRVRVTNTNHCRKRRQVVIGDRISGLPQSIIHDHILPCLSTKDIKLMTCLSKTWYNICNSFPFLNFDHFPLGQQMNSVRHTSYDYDLLQMYLAYVRQSLQRFYNHDDQILRKLTIPLHFSPKVAPLLDSLIESVLQHGVEEFNLHITYPTYYVSESNLLNPEKHTSLSCYNLPRHVFAAPYSSIKVAHLKGCNLLHSFPNPNHTTLSMKKLCLAQVLMDETTLSCIISCCPLIEELTLFHCMGVINCLRISNLRKLKALNISNWDKGKKSDQTTVEIDAPSLQSLQIQGSLFKVCILGYYPVLTDLHLECVWELEELELQDILSRLPIIRTLSLLDIVSLTKLKLSSDTLNKLTVKGCKYLVELQIDAPNLLSVSYDQGNTSFPPPDLLVLACSPSVRWDVTTGYNGSDIRFGTLENFLVDFVSKMKHVKCLKLYVRDVKNHFIFEGLQQRVIQARPIAKEENLNLMYLYTGDSNNNHLLLVDCLLWSFHPRTLSVKLKFGESHENHVVAKRMCRVIMDHRGGCCSCTLARSSWLHRLEDVMAVITDDKEKRLRMDGNSSPRFHCSYREIKFIFK